ncbi:hypothetical protein [Effusibacillus pohliae]|nr:hypothetical protein [Effusibacillus pohliae]
MEWNAVNMSIVASLIFIVVVLFNFFIVLAMPNNKEKRKQGRK